MRYTGQRDFQYGQCWGPVLFLCDSVREPKKKDNLALPCVKLEHALTDGRPQVSGKGFKDGVVFQLDSLFFIGRGKMMMQYGKGSRPSCIAHVYDSGRVKSKIPSGVPELRVFWLLVVACQ